METLRDLFIANNSYIISGSFEGTAGNYSFFIENLDKNGGGQVEEFSADRLSDNNIIEILKNEEVLKTMRLSDTDIPLFIFDGLLIGNLEEIIEEECE